MSGAVNHALSTKRGRFRRRQLQIDELVTLVYAEQATRMQVTVKT